MKTLNCSFLIAFSIFLIIQSTAASDCEERAKKVSVNFTTCCKYPEFGTDKEFKEIGEAIAKGGVDPKKENDLFSCLFFTKFFENKKLMDDKKEIDKAGCLKFIVDVTKDTAFKDFAEKIVDNCFEETAKHAETYQKDSKIPKDKCMVKYDFMADCVKLEMFAKCPKDAWSNDEKIKDSCDFCKKFVEECYEDDKAMEIFEQTQTEV